MSRRPSLPGAAELFRVTSGGTAAEMLARRPAATPPRDAAAPDPSALAEAAQRLREHPVASATDADSDAEAPAAGVARLPSGRGGIRAVRSRRPTGRERHDEKITVYCSQEELVDLEQARLLLRAEHGLAVDRGRIVREAIAVVLADLDARGDASIIVRRLRGL